MKYFPARNQQYTYLQTNRSNVLGSVWSSMCFDLQSNLGVLRITDRFQVNTKTGDSGATNLGIPVAFKFFDRRYFSICGSRVFKNSAINITSAFTEDASTGFVTTYSEDGSGLELFNDTLCANTYDGSISKLYSKVADGAGAGAWTDRGSLGNLTYIIKYFFKKNRLYAAGGTKVTSVSTAWVVASSGDYSLDLGTGLNGSITCMVPDDFNLCLWIGTNSNNLGEGYSSEQASVFKWDGISAQADSKFLVPATGVMAMVIRKNYPAILDSNGILRQFDGSNFEEIGRLPLKPNQYLGFTTNTSNVGRFIHPEGLIVTENDTILALIRNENIYTLSTDINVNENLPSGVWEWSKENGFVHKGILTYTPVGSSTITDFGQNILSSVGALVSAKVGTETSMGTLLVGAEYYTDATTKTKGIFINQPKPSNVSFPDVQKKGYFVTTLFTSNEIADAWDEIWSTFKPLQSTDNIVFKYRTKEEEPVVATITYVNTTTFTVLNSAVDVSQYWTSGVGGEVEILQGTGGNSCVHITNAVNNAGTWTVTVDTVITGVTTGTAKARFQKWIKIFPKNDLTTNTDWQVFAVGTTSTPRIQIKGCITWTGDQEFYKFNLSSNEDITSKK